MVVIIVKVDSEPRHDPVSPYLLLSVLNARHEAMLQSAKTKKKKLRALPSLMGIDETDKKWRGLTSITENIGEPRC